MKTDDYCIFNPSSTEIQPAKISLQSNPQKNTFKYIDF